MRKESVAEPPLFYQFFEKGELFHKNIEKQKPASAKIDVPKFACSDATAHFPGLLASCYDANTPSSYRGDEKNVSAV